MFFEVLKDPSCLPSFIIAFIIFGFIVFKILRIFFNEGIFQHIKDDWIYRLPYRLDTMKFKGANRPAYTLICLMYYSIKSIFLFLLATEIYFFKFVLWDIWKFLFKFEDRAWYKKLFCNFPSDRCDQYEDYVVDEEDSEIDNEYTRPTFSNNSLNIKSPGQSKNRTSKINNLWYSEDEEMWKNALKAYWHHIKANQINLEKEFELIKVSDIDTLSVYEFYDFLYQRYFPWKFTDNRYLYQNRKHLEKYLLHDEIDILAKIKKRLFNLNFNDIKECLVVASGIYGLGTAGGSGLLSILYPEHFGTVDRFVVYSLLEIEDLPERAVVASMNAKSLTLNNGVVLIEIMRNKANELNRLFNTDFWTPRKIDMVLWSMR